MIMGTACGSRFPSAIAFIAPRLAPGHAARDAGRQRWIQHLANRGAGRHQRL